jgi:hypothetical protein
VVRRDLNLFERQPSTHHLPDADIIVSPSYIKLGEVLHAFESIDEIIDEGERVSISSCDGTECSIVLDEAELTILLLDEEDWGT